MSYNGLFLRDDFSHHSIPARIVDLFSFSILEITWHHVTCASFCILLFLKVATNSFCTSLLLGLCVYKIPRFKITMPFTQLQSRSKVKLPKVHCYWCWRLASELGRPTSAYTVTSVCFEIWGLFASMAQSTMKAESGNDVIRRSQCLDDS